MNASAPSQDEDIPAEIDFSGGVRGKFHRPNVRLNLPVYLDADVQAYLSALAAKKGVAAQTVASYGLYPDYHQPSDDLAHINFKHLNAAIGSLIGPIEWLANSAFVPKWNEGGRP